MFFSATRILLIGFITRWSLSTYVTHPVSLNASLNSTVTFTCEATGVTVIIFFVGDMLASAVTYVSKGFDEGAQKTINGTIKQRNLSVYAQLINNNTNISCITSPGDLRSETAALKIQGK